MSDRVLWLGLDAADQATVGAMLASGRMPTLAGALAGGTVAPLRSSALPITPAAWAGMYTGMNPGKTGILTWQRARNDYRSHLVNHQDISQFSLYQHLPAHGKHLVSIGFPLSSPLPHDGLVFAGWDAPEGGPHCNDAAWSARLEELGFSVADEFSVDEGSQRRNIRARFRLASAIDREQPWDCLGIYLAFIDHLGHRLGAGNDVTPRLLELFDAELGLLLSQFDDVPTLLLTSDHGFGSFTRSFSVTQWLATNGYLALKSNIVLRSENASRGLESVDVRADIDWSQTRAFCVDAIGSYAGIKLNLAGTMPAGVVPPREAWKLTEELRERLLTTNANGLPLISKVWRREELFWGDKVPLLPELILECVPNTAALFGKWHAESQALHLEPTSFLHEGQFNSHLPNGIWGSSFSCSGDLRVEDVAPTIYGLLGLAIPNDVDGVDRSGRAAPSGPAHHMRSEDSKPYSEQEEELVRKRLEALGYL